MDIFLEKSKTDQYRDGRKVVIAKGSTSACPVAMLKKYYDLTGLQLLDVKGEDGNLFLFRPMYRSKSTCKLIKKNKQLSYNRVRKCVLEKLKMIPEGWLHSGQFAE